MAPTLIAVLAVMAACGTFGGYAGYLLTPPTDDQLQRATRSWWARRAVVLGLASSLAVPLSLRIIGSVVGAANNLLEQMLSTPDHRESWFVFAGFCLVAAIASQRFLPAITDSVLKNLQREIDHVKTLAAATQQDVVDLADDAQEMAKQEGVAANLPGDRSEHDGAILACLASPPRQRGTSSAIAQATGLSETVVRESLNSLERRRLVQRSSDSPSGSERWRIRLQGRALLETQLAADPAA